MSTPTGTQARSATKTAGAVALVAAVWLAVSAPLLGYEDVTRAFAVQLLAGAVLAALGVLLLRRVAARPASVAMVWLGLAVAVAPIVMRFGYVDRSAAAYVNGILVGLVLVAVGVWSAKRLSR